MRELNKYQVATSIAILFHLIGLLGILFFDREYFIKATSYNLVLMFILLLYTHTKINGPFLFFIIICFITGITVELIGTKTGWLFGNYKYGDVLGPEIQQVPYIIGLNWFIIIYCCGITIHTMLTRITQKLALQTGTPPATLRAISIVIDGATIAVLFDWIMEPVAISLGYWTWEGYSEVPLFNYLCWFVISSLLLMVFHFSAFSKKNRFAVNLLLIQMMFFLLLRTFL